MMADDFGWHASPTEEQILKQKVSALSASNTRLQDKNKKLEDELRAYKETPLKKMLSSFWYTFEGPIIGISVALLLISCIALPIYLIESSKKSRVYESCEFMASLESTKYKVDPANLSCYIFDKKENRYQLTTTKRPIE